MALTTHNPLPTTHYLVADHLGSTRSLINPNGTKISEANYYPYGQTRTQTGSLPSRQYTGQVNDDSTGLYFYNARYYNPTTANFLSVDKGSSMNKYIYVNGNPINFSDPTGNEGEDTVNPENDCNTNPFSSFCITLSPIDYYFPIQATQPLTAQPCYSQEECQANQEFAVATLAFLGLTMGGGAVAEIAAPALLSQATLLYIVGSNLWSQFASSHPKLSTGIDIGSDLVIGVSPSGLSMYRGLLRRGVNITHEGSWTNTGLSDEGQITVNLAKNFAAKDIFHEAVHVSQIKQALNSGLTPKQIKQNFRKGIPRALGELEASSKEIRAAKILGKDENSILGSKKNIEVFEDVIREYGGTLPVNYNLIDNPYAYGLR